MPEKLSQEPELYIPDVDVWVWRAQACLPDKDINIPRQLAALPLLKCTDDSTVPRIMKEESLRDWPIVFSDSHVSFERFQDLFPDTVRTAPTHKAMTIFDSAKLFDSIQEVKAWDISSWARHFNKHAYQPFYATRDIYPAKSQETMRRLIEFTINGTLDRAWPTHIPRPAPKRIIDPGTSAQSLNQLIDQTSGATEDEKMMRVRQYLSNISIDKLPLSEMRDQLDDLLMMNEVTTQLFGSN